MRTYKEYQLRQFVTDTITCDKCGKVITEDKTVEFQEALNINFWAGYGSVFGDGAEVNLDFCQDCAKELIGSYLK